MHGFPRVARLMAVTALILSACSTAATPAPTATPTAAPSGSAAGGDLTIFAASSLTASFKDLAAAYKTATGTTVTLAFDASSALETQIEQGAPADILASADTTNPKKLVDAGFAVAPPIDFAGNTLTIIVPGTGTSPVSTPEDLAKPAVKVIGAGDAVPITRYATQLIANLAKLPGYPADYVNLVTKNIVSKEDNVKAVVAKLELGEGDAAIVYVTDAAASTKVKTVKVPDEANVPATYAAVAVKAAKNPTGAAAFLTWLTGADAQAILAKYGFTPPPTR